MLSAAVVISTLTFITLSADSADDKFIRFFYLFLEKRIWNFMQTAWNVKFCFLRKIRKISWICHLLKILPKVLSIKGYVVNHLQSARNLLHCTWSCTWLIQYSDKQFCFSMKTLWLHNYGNVLKFQTIYAIILGLKFAFLWICFLKCIVECKQDFRSSLIWACTVCICDFIRNICLQKFRTFTVDSIPI